MLCRRESIWSFRHTNNLQASGSLGSTYWPEDSSTHIHIYHDVEKTPENEVTPFYDLSVPTFGPQTVPTRKEIPLPVDVYNNQAENHQREDNIFIGSSFPIFESVSVPTKNEFPRSFDGESSEQDDLSEVSYKLLLQSLQDLSNSTDSVDLNYQTKNLRAILGTTPKVQALISNHKSFTESENQQQRKHR